MADWGDEVDAQEKGLAGQVEKLAINKNESANTQASNSTSKPGTTNIDPILKAADTSGNSADTSAQPADTPAQPAQAAAKAAEEATEEKVTTKEDESYLRKLLRNQLVKTKNDIEILRKDPSNPLYSVKSFEALNLKPELLKGVYDMGFNAPSKIQETALPTLLADPPVNMIAQSQSGTGKTAAFVLTMLSRCDTTINNVQCLCLAPTYELALQIGEVTEQMAKHMTDCKIGYAVRGQRVPRGQKVQYHILIGTPGTVMDWSIKLKVLDLRKIQVFVLDEADVMIATQGHQDQSLRIQRNLGVQCQMLLFSATYDADVMKFAQAVIPNDPVVIRLRREEESLDNIKQYYIECQDEADKFQALSNIYGTISIGQSMIFCQTRRTASWLAEKMTKEGHAVGLLSGELAIEQRAAIIHRFRNGKEKVLITTNVSARGIDVEQVTVVVNFDLPTLDRKPDNETYLHRIGRTGRFGKNGIAINMVDSKRSMDIMRSIENHFGRKITKLDADDAEEIEKIST
ncbi:ATP-dependent RNA helicase DDX19A-like [Haliotis rubra]|uniref:ATP-dependent RNA helicase DDX19A-like n=1 Tax=Haliotis rubra TaxID=36100 RepID=UPI001EE59BB4|nr:ATP-dependent RNA helicase DDX19A-like [Haliotis rubra]XP_046564540.1 ATP-dependent RNA helicase DDX19A-like [Haliotis rubra]